MGLRKLNRVYIAAASSDIERVKRCRAHLQAGGVRVTSRWIDEVIVTGANPPNDAERKRRALSDVQDLDQSDLIWFLVPHGVHTTRGAWWEHGYMYRAGKPLVASGMREDLIKSVFTALGDEFESDVDAIIRILRTASALDDADDDDDLDRPNPYTKE